MKETELKTCPFCDSHVERYLAKRLGVDIPVFRCTNTKTCGAVVTFDSDEAFEAHGHGREEYLKAVEGRWNTRADEPWLADSYELKDASIVAVTIGGVRFVRTYGS